MTTDWKALCAELAETLAEEYGVQREFDSGDPLLGSGAIELLSRVRTALDQPEPPSRLRHCPTHGQQPENAWGCPECVREMRQQLAQPEPQGLTDEEILNLSEEHCVSYTRLDGSVTYPYENDMNMKDDVLFFARALIAADRARCGRPAIQPEPEEPTDSESTKDKINNSLMKFNYEKTSNHSDN